jgi:hypothetical protein
VSHFPDHPDSGPRLSQTTVESVCAAITAGEAQIYGRSHGKDHTCYWWCVKWRSRNFIFLSAVEPSQWAWEVSAQAITDYAEVVF